MKDSAEVGHFLTLEKKKEGSITHLTTSPTCFDHKSLQGWKECDDWSQKSAPRAVVTMKNTSRASKAYLLLTYPNDTSLQVWKKSVHWFRRQHVMRTPTLMQIQCQQDLHQKQ